MADTRPFTREQILAQLKAEIKAGRPIIGAGCSSGLIARSAAAGGADIIIVYNTGRTRLMGLPTSHLLNHANPTTLTMYREIANVVTDRPIVGGGEASDPTYMNLTTLVKDFMTTGFDGMINFPTQISHDRSPLGLGVERDWEMVAIARKLNYFTICYGYTADQTRGLAAAGADVIVGHAGWTTGGLAGARESAAPLEKGCEHVQKMIEIARKENPDVICLAHGGPIATAEDTAYLYKNTDAQGFLGASSVERIPVETSLMEAVKAFKAKQLPAANIAF